MSDINFRKVSGHVETTGLWGELQFGQTLSCCHCQHTRVLAKGSGRAWGFCTRCMGYHCDNPVCFECVPWERRVENLEAGRAELTPLPASVIVPPEIVGISGFNAGG